jgi:TrmH family RNA methyltransferase
MGKLITSLHNPDVRNAILIGEKQRERKMQGLFMIEGCREAGLAAAAGYVVNSAYYCPEILAKEKALEILCLSDDLRLNEVSREVYNRMAYRKDAEGLICVAETRDLTPFELKLPSNPLVLVIESVEKPGNLGAVMRTADAAGLHAVIICDKHTDIYNPNAIRSSIGCVFTVPLATATSEETLQWLKCNSIEYFPASLEAGRLYHECAFTGPTAFIMGTESTGLSAVWTNEKEKLIKIPMLGRIDSMNVSVSAAILVFEAMRQRNFII